MLSWLRRSFAAKLLAAGLSLALVGPFGIARSVSRWMWSQVSTT